MQFSDLSIHFYLKFVKTYRMIKVVFMKVFVQNNVGDDQIFVYVRNYSSEPTKQRPSGSYQGWRIQLGRRNYFHAKTGMIVSWSVFI